jgi:hypothetical protein
MYGKSKYKLSDTIGLKWILQKFVRHGFYWRQMALASFCEHDNELLYSLEVCMVSLTTSYVAPIVVGRKTMPTVLVLALNDGLCGTAEISIYM